MAQPPSGGFRRRIIIIKRAAQMKYVMLVLLSVIITMVVLSLDMYYVLGKFFVEQSREPTILPILKDATQLLAIHFSFYLFIVFIISIFVSHKFAGPLFRLEKVAESITSGDLTVKAFFRQGDELGDTAESMNRMIESLRERILKEKNLSERITKKLTEISTKLSQNKLTSKQAASQLEQILIEVKHICSDFKV